MKIGVDYIGVGCGALIINDKNEIILIKRSKNTQNNAGYWSLSGGTVEFGEKVTDTIKREIKEELDIEVEDPYFLGYIDDIIPEESQHWVGMNFWTKIKSGEPKNMEPDKHEEFQWFSLDALPEKLHSPAAQTIKLYIEQQKNKD